MLRLKRRRRSAGVPVTEVVYQILRRANDARDKGDPARARDDYEHALELAPGLAHIWVQLGHARSETGDRSGAVQAYQRAILAGEDAGEASLFIGHAHKRSKDNAHAAAAYLAGVKHGNATAASELAALTDMVFPIEQSVFDDIVAVMRAREDSEPGSQPSAMDGDTAAGIVYDLSDLVAHFRHLRMPSGIQRFQIEVVERALLRADFTSRLCCFISGRDELIEIAPAQLAAMIQLTREAGGIEDPMWQRARATFFIALATQPPLVFREGDCLVNLGTSWWIHNYSLIVRNARRDYGLRYISMVFDLVPVLATGFCVRGLVEQYVNWLISAFDHTDMFLCISRSTASDLVDTAARLGTSLRPERIAVVPLDADFRSAKPSDAVAGDIHQYGLTDHGYVLFVSTIEGRKNHVLALRAWEMLLERRAAADVPTLVFVGRNGWLNTDVYRMLDQNKELRAKVMIIESAPDADLAALYGHCLCTIYTSLYEGWGLPVTESLCYCKVPIVASNSSLPEAGGDFAQYFESDSVESLLKTVEPVLFDNDWRRAEEARIAAHFAPRPWSAVADQVVSAAQFVNQSGSLVGDAATIDVGTYYPIRRYGGTRIWRGLGSGELFRVGTGWHWPDEVGCWTQAGGGMMRIPTASPGREMRLFVHLRGLIGEECRFRITCGDATTEGTLEPSLLRWSRGLDVTVAHDGCLDVEIHGLDIQEVNLVESGRLIPRVTSVGVIGFMLCDPTDDDTLMNFLQAVTANDLEGLSAYREHRSLDGKRERVDMVDFEAI